MKNKVYLTAFSIRLPGIETIDDIEGLVSGKLEAPDLKKLKLSNGQEAEFGELIIDESGAYFPQRQDAKVMRRDVLAASICAGELAAIPPFQVGDVTNIPLYLSGGVFIEEVFNQNDKVSQYFRETMKISDDLKRREMMYKIVPPLLALNTLTNASSSYVAQYSKFAGHNATQGNTSVSGSYSAMAAWREIKKGREFAVAGATNRGELYSYLTFSRFFDASEIWRESCGAVLFALSGEKKPAKGDPPPLCEIVEISFSINVPSLINPAVFERLEVDKLMDSDELVIFSGAFTNEIYRKQLELFSNGSGDCFSWFPVLGNMGPINNFMNILAAIIKLRTGRYQTALCVDKDPYGRESFVRIRLPQ